MYKSINDKLIKNNMVKAVHSNKDFTYILWDGDVPSLGHWWDGKLASVPSWLDYFFTYSLMVFPLLLVVLINFLTSQTGPQ